MSFSSGKDLTRGNAAWNLLNFAVPFLLAFFLQIFYGTVDVIAVGRFGGGSSDVSAVASGSEVMQLVASLIAGLTTGATVLIGQCYGAKDYQSVNRCIGMTLSISLLASILLTAVMVPMIPLIARWLNTPPEAFEQTVAYGTICSWGIVFIFGYNALSAIFRGLGNSTAPLIFVGIACVVNIVGDLLLVIVFHMGVTGVAIATVSSQALSMLFALIFLYRSDFGFRFHARDFRISWKLAWSYATIGIPIGVQGIVVGLSFLFIFTIVNSMGLAASAGYGICNKINGFAMLPAIAFSMAISAATAQNIGAQKPYRAIRTLWLGVGYTMSFGAVALVLLQCFPRQFITLFLEPSGADAEAAIAAATSYIRSFSWEFILVPIVFCTNGFFNGCGRSFFSMANNLGGTFFVRLPAAYLLSHLSGATLFEVGFAAPLASFVSNVVALIYRWSGRWRDRRPCGTGGEEFSTVSNGSQSSA